MKLHDNMPNYPDTTHTQNVQSNVKMIELQKKSLSDHDGDK